MMVQTEFGKLEVGDVSSKDSKKQYLCPLCGEDIEIGEAHKFISPEIREYRRHLHSDCVEQFHSRNLTIKLHPNSSA